MTHTQPEFPTFAQRVSAAANSHDIDRVVACFAEDYRNETPVHPSRGFVGREQVRRNWTRIFAAVPDIRTTVLRADQVGDTVWSEWEMSGTRLDGTAHLMRGVMVFTVDGERASAVRFYLEEVDEGDQDVDEAVERLVGGSRS